MKLTKDITGVLEGNVYPTEILAGTHCPPELADAAIALDAVSVEDAEKFIKDRDEAKAKARNQSRAKAAAPENKALTGAGEVK